MHLAIAMFALATGSVPSAGLIASFGGDLQLTLGQDNGPPPGSPYPPPPPLVVTPPLPHPPPAADEFQPPPIVEVPDEVPRSDHFPPPPLPHAPIPLAAAEPPAQSQGSIPVAYWEAFAANLGLRLVFEAAATFSFALADLAFNPICGGPGNVPEGVAFLIPGIAAMIGQPFAIAGVVGAIFHGQRLYPRYWTSFWSDVLTTLVLAPLAGLLIGELVNLATDSNGSNSGPAIVTGISAFVVAGAFGAPTGANLSLPSQAAAPAPHAALGIPLVRLTFN